MFDWNDLRYFVAVAREGSTLAAAKALGVSQPTVQRRLAYLEQQVARRLFEPHPTGYQLTEIGKALLPHALQIEEAVAAFERQLQAIGDQLTGTVRVTCPEAEIDRLLTPLMDRFRARHPGLTLEFVVTDRVLDLSKGEADVALRGGVPKDSKLVGRKLADTPWFVYASRSYLERHGKPARPQDLERHAIIAFTGPLAELSPARWLRSVAPNASIAGYSSGVLGALSAVKAGIGLAILPALLGRSEPDLVCAFAPEPEVTEPFMLLVHPDLRSVPRIRAFMDFVFEEIGPIRALLKGESHNDQAKAER